MAQLRRVFSSVSSSGKALAAASVMSIASSSSAIIVLVPFGRTTSTAASNPRLPAAQSRTSESVKDSLMLACDVLRQPRPVTMPGSELQDESGSQIGSQKGDTTWALIPFQEYLLFCKYFGMNIHAILDSFYAFSHLLTAYDMPSNACPNDMTFLPEA